MGGFRGFGDDEPQLAARPARAASIRARALHSGVVLPLD
jgi:hypothetical protein